ncbi:MAG: O-antigen ligase family protein, partial [Parvibaculum sp.]|nr:O-antigen ligase family protein [Parvibaculum sp.]
MNRFVATPETWLFRALILIVALVPLRLGANAPALTSFSAGLLLFGWAGIALWRGSIQSGATLARRMAVPCTLFLLVALWAFLQWAPLGFASHPLWQLAGDALERDLPGRISIRPDATLAALSNLLGYGAIFWVSLEMSADADRARQARNAVIAIGSAYAIYGLAKFFAGAGLAPESFDIPRQAALTSTFGNRNSFATFAGLALLATSTLFIERIQHTFSVARPLRQKIALILETLTYRGRWVTAAILLIALALLLTGSRGGIIASLTAFAALMLLQARKSSRGSHRGVVAAITLGLVGVALAIAGGNFLDRVSQQGLSIENGLRLTIFTTTVEAIKTAPLAGTGYGTYSEAIEAYRPPGSDIFKLWERAHNTYLENAREPGMPAAVALVLAILWLAVLCFNGVRNRRRNRAYPAIGAAA